MLLVNHFVGPSAIDGLGVFTSEHIRTGQEIWHFNPLIDREISLPDLITLPDAAILQVMRHAEFHPERQSFVLAADGDYYMNHADQPSLVDAGRTMYAARDLEVGEELTCDYRVVQVVEFHPDQPSPHFRTLLHLRQRADVLTNQNLSRINDSRAIARAG